MKYRNQLRYALYKVYGKKIANRKFKITSDSKNDRTLGLIVPVDGNLHLQHWLWRYGWKVVYYKGMTMLASDGYLESTFREADVSIMVQAAIYMEVRKLEPQDREYKTHPMHKSEKPKEQIASPMEKPHGTLPKEI